MSGVKLAILGVTGGVGKAAALRALEQGAAVTVLVRDPARLDHQIKDSGAIVLIGDATNPEDVKSAIANHNVLLFSIGGKPVFTWTGITVDNPTICENGMAAVQQVYKEARRDSTIKLPERIIAVSTTGLKPGHVDVPYVFRTLYSWVLHVPHEDKRRMEAILHSIPDVDKIVLHCSLFTDGAGSTDIQSGPDVIGYTISRTSVGWFVADHCLIDTVSGNLNLTS